MTMRSISMNAFGGSISSNEGNKTNVIYSLIRDMKYADAIKQLNVEVSKHPRSRSALSLLGYCFYHQQDFKSAANVYDQLVRFHPDVSDYKVYYAQSLYKAGLYPEASKASTAVEDQQYSYRMLRLQAAIKYEQDDLSATKIYVDQCVQEDPDTIIAQACLLFKEGEFEKARQTFTEAATALGNQPDLMYNIGVCYYKMKLYPQALKCFNEIVDRGVKDHPELSIGTNTEGLDVRSVGNTQALKETSLIEAFNLKAAIEYQLKNYEGAKEALTDMPPRSEKELDPVTLHNQALMNMEEDATEGIQKLNYLLAHPPFPLETFGNLLLTYVKYKYFHVAADVLAENVHLHETCLSEELYEYLEAMIESASSPESAYKKFDILSSKHVDTLRKLTKQIQDARHGHDAELTKNALKEYDEAVERYIPVLMAQAKIYWDLENYAMVEKLFKQSTEFCSEHDIWKLNVAHVFFMQEKYKEAIRYYDPFIQKQKDNLLDVTAIVLANLCVSYIMTTLNEEAEELMKEIEKEEETASQSGGPESGKQRYHLCIVNLVIGTLYCAKGNFEFGISRITKSLEPYNKKLGPDTWFYAKRCFLALMETLAKHMMLFKDEFFHEVSQFFDAAEENGKEISTIIASQQQGQEASPTDFVAYEARLFKRMLSKLRE
eukprot:TRINITY_DN2574_c0_g1_i1.p1 TRINITY_DN2574_c0_g1~~TRINITY_DN2574_c0_g1_i1.p1  ORF type:complete len:661 (+),score=182.05 TRINITY_DN2574_c0_g1_i1:50-2032(+)